MERIIYYGFAAVMGALIAFAIVVLYTKIVSPVIASVGAAALLIVLFDALQHEFSIPNNKRALGFVFVLFVSGLISVIVSSIVLQ